MAEPRRARSWRVHQPEFPRERDALVRLTREESHHVQRVLRLRVGESLSLFDGRGSEWSATIESLASGATTVRLVAPMAERVDPKLAVTLFQGLCRNDRMEWLIQKATELGVGAIRPWQTRRVEVRPPTAARLERWQRIAVEACKQCGRRRIPTIDPCDDLPVHPSGLILHPGSGAPSLGSRLVQAAADEPALAVGPEGGLDDDEIANWTRRGWSLAELGPRTLRTETAGIAALAILLHRLDDLGSAPDLT